MAECRVGIVGCGNIATPYTDHMMKAAGIELVGVTDIDTEAARALGERHGLAVYPDLDTMLADSSLELIVNLTIHHAHFEVSRRCLEGDKHVYSEKPLAMASAEAHALVDLAEARGLRLGCSPFTFMGEAQQTAWRLIREGELGTVRLVYAEVNHGRIESWHPNPAPFYEVGPLFDVGVYPLTLVTTMFGPITRVSAFGTTLHPDRVTKDGTPFRVASPDFVVASLSTDGGPTIRLTVNFYVGGHNKQGSAVEAHGDAASLYLSRWDSPGATVAVAPFAGSYRERPLLRPGPEGLDWSVGIQDLVAALREDRPHRATGTQAAHVVDVLTATATSLAEGRPHEVASTFPPPVPMDWAGKAHA